MNKYRHRQLTLALILLCAGVEFFGVQAYAYGSQAMMDGLRLTRTEFAFASTVYTVGCILAIFKQHWLVTRYGYRSFLLYSLALYGVASLACALSTSLTMLSVMRFFQGLGGGALFLSSRLMVSVLLDQRDFFTGIKWMSHGMYVVPIGAPLLSGWMIQEYGWPGIFYLMAALSVPTWWIARQALFHYRATDLTEKHSPLAALAFAGGVFLLEFIIQEYAWIAEQPRPVKIMALSGIVFGMLGFLVAQRGRTKWIDPSIINSQPFLVGGLLSFMFYLLIVQFQYVMPVFASSQGLSWEHAGLLIGVFNIFAYICFLFYQRTSRHLTSIRVWMSLGASGMGIGCMLMYVLSPADHMFWYLVPLALQSGFAVFVMIPLSIHMFRGMSGAFYSHGYRTRMMMGKVAASLAITTAAVPIQHRVSDGALSLFQATREQFLVMAGISLVYLLMINIQRTLR